MLAWLTLHAHACAPVVPLDAFRAELDAIWSAVKSGDLAAAREHERSAEAALACLDAPLTPGDAAAFERGRAVTADYEGDAFVARTAATAAARLAPDLVADWSAEVPRFAGLVGAPADAGVEDLATSLAAALWVDGQAAARRPTGTPVILQLFDLDGAPISGAWVDARDPAPDWVAFPPIDCHEEVGLDEILTLVSRAEQAYARLEVDVFESALRTVASDLPCVRRRLTPAQAAAVHRLEGLRQAAHGSAASAVRSFQEARALDAAYTPPPDVVRPDTTLASLWDAGGRPPTGLRVDIVPPGLALTVDGAPGASRAASAPAIVQLETPSGVVLWTRYVPVGQPLPAVAPWAAEAARIEAERLPPALRLYRDEGRGRSTRLRRSELLLAGVALLTASAATYVVNANAVGDYHDPETPFDRLRSLRRSANTSATVGSILLLGGCGLTVVAAAVR